MAMYIGTSKTCETCKAELIRTSELYYSCPNAHGRLVQACDPRPRIAERENKRAANLFAKYLPRYLRWLKKWAGGGSSQAAIHLQRHRAERNGPSLG